MRANPPDKADRAAAGGTPDRPRRVLPVIILSQLAGTSLWFAGNAVLNDLQRRLGLAPGAIGFVTAAVQLGFIAGTLSFAFFSVSDLLPARAVFFVCCIAGGAANAASYGLATDLASLLAWRFLTGFFLAGIYPVGMKIAASWYDRDLGNALGFLVGALVLGTAFPHLLRGVDSALPAAKLMYIVSAAAMVGGLAMFVLVPEGPYLRRAGTLDPRAVANIFRVPAFRASAFGYFGHMWELYAFWAFVPLVLATYAAERKPPEINVPLWAFLAIAAGSLGCVVGGIASLRMGSARVAFLQLAASGLCCIASPFLFTASAPVFLGFLLLWGVVVVGDSPQFSALNAAYAPRELVGSALTMVNCIGFAITIASIGLLNAVAHELDARWLFVMLAPGPLLGLAALRVLVRPALSRASA